MGPEIILYVFLALAGLFILILVGAGVYSAGMKARGEDFRELYVESRKEFYPNESIPYIREYNAKDKKWSKLREEMESFVRRGANAERRLKEVQEELKQYTEVTATDEDGEREVRPN